MLARNDPFRLRKYLPTPFSRHLAEARAALHLTQAELAAYLQVAVQSVSNWEVARATPFPHNEARVRALLARALRRRGRPDIGERI